MVASPFKWILLQVIVLPVLHNLLDDSCGVLRNCHCERVSSRALMPNLCNSYCSAIMVEKEINGHKVKIYEAIDELNINRFHRFQKYLLVDAGVGADIAAFDRHTERARVYMMQGKTDLAATEFENLRQCVYLIQQGINPKHRAFAVLVASIDGEPCDDLSDSGLDRVLERLDPKVSEVSIDAVKKNLIRN